MSRFETLMKSVSAVKIPKPRITSEEDEGGAIKVEMEHPETGHSMRARFSRDSNFSTEATVQDFDSTGKNVFGPGMMRQLARHLHQEHGVETISHGDQRKPTKDPNWLNTKRVHIDGEFARENAQRKAKGLPPKGTPMQNIAYDRAEQAYNRNKTDTQIYAPGERFI